VLVADPDDAGRAAVRATLEQAGAVYSEAKDLPRALADLRRERPDACLIEPGLAAGAVAAILEAAPGLPVIVLSVCPTDADLLAAVAAGASGHLRKDLGAHALAAAIGDVVAGRRAFPRRVETLLAAGLRATPKAAT
jgi:DNA-binding NarL/FixJ family response regulator